MSGRKTQRKERESSEGRESQSQQTRNASSSSSSSSSPSSSASPPPPQLTLLLHHAAFRNDIPELTKLLESKTYDINSVDVNGNTALHIGVMLHHTATVDLLLTHGAKVNLKNKNGFSSIHEAVSVGDRDILRKLWQHYKSRARESQELSGFLAHLHSIPQFQVKLQWRVQSWFPFIGRFLPSDEIIISKKGNDVRIDTHMLEFVGMQWKHHPYSFLIKPKKDVEAEEKANEKERREKGASASPGANDASSVEGDKSSTSADKSDEKKEPIFIYSLDHELKVWQCVSTDEEKEKLELETKRKREQQEKEAREAKGDAPPSADIPSSADSSSSSAASSSSSSSSVPDVDLEYELDDFQDRPITSFFSPGRLKFTPVAASTWKSAWNGMKNMVSSWGSWAIGGGSSSSVSQPKPDEVAVKTERVHSWLAEEWSVENIRIHTLKRYEHLTKEEIANLHARGAAFKSMLTNPLALKKKLQEGEEESDEEEEEEEGSGEGGAAKNDTSSQSVADAVNTQTEKQKKKKAKKPFEHRKSLQPPPPTTVTFAQYFHKRNTVAYAALDMEELFEKERDEDLEKSMNEAAAKGIKEEQIELKELQPQEEGEASEGRALLHSEASADSQLEPSAAEIEAANQLAQQQAASHAAHHPKLHHHSDATHHPLLLSEVNSNNSTPYIHLGRAMVSDSSRKVYAGKVWMVPANQFPLKMTTVVNVVDLLFGTYIPSLVAKFKAFVTQELPRDRFPLRMHMPVFPAISFDLSISDFKQRREPGQAKLPTLKVAQEGEGEEGETDEVDEPADADVDDDSPLLFTVNNACCGTTDESTFFNIPHNYEREKQTEEELHAKQQRYRKRWKADQKRNSSKQ